MDIAKPGSPGWWLNLLSTQLTTRRAGFDTLLSYTDGTAPLPEGAQNVRAAYQTFQEKSRTNFGELVVEAVAERMTPVGFEAGEQLSERARAIWNANELDTFANDIHTDMLTLGMGYAMVGEPDENGNPVITREDPRYTITAHDPLRPNRVIAALKVYHDDVEAKDFACVYLPGYAFLASRPSSVGSEPQYSWAFDRWVNDGKLSVPDAMPVVRFLNRSGKGEFETHTDILDRINYMLLQRLVITAMQAFRQRAVKGDLPEYQTDADGNPLLDDDGEPVPVDYAALFKPGPGSLWMLPESVELWESGQASIQEVLNAVKNDIRDLAAVTRTPMFMLMPDGTNQSAEGASAAREGLVFKCTDRIQRATYGWNQVMGLALRFAGENPGNVTVQWAPPERLSLTERADAATKLVSVMPRMSLLTEIMQFSPEKAERMERELLDDILVSGLAAPVTNGAQ